MNSKAIKRQLLAAIAMVLVAAIALGSSTYAWFVASSTVTAKGMNVQAMSESGLAISHDGQKWGSVSTTNLGQKTLAPTSTKDLTNWYHATALDPSVYAAATGATGVRENVTAQVLPSGEYAPTNSYVFRDKFDIRSTATDTNQSKGLYVSNITVTAGDKATEQTMSTALRVGVAYTDKATNNTVTKIFAPVTIAGGTNNTPTKTYTVYDENGAAIGGSFTVDEYGATTANLISADTPIPHDTSISVYIYIWFEGEDRNLYSDNFHAEDLFVSVEFSSIDSTT